MIFNTHYPYIGGGGGGGMPQFTYTGQYSLIDDGGGNWRIKLLTSGTFKPLKNMAIDAFLVGAGGGGGSNPSPTREGASSGGGGGFTKTVRSINLTKNTTYQITVGVGGAPGVDGGSTTAFNEKAGGGKKGSSITGIKRAVAGGAGGSGGGGASTSNTNAGSGGSDGSNGSPASGVGAGGTGQGTTTREFGEASGKLYSGGGGGTYYYINMSKPAGGGVGGGAKGKESAADNTGGGGGGGDGSGGSGIVIVRNAR